MPTYDYHCPKCGKKFERFQGINEKPLSKCPKCGGKPDRLIGSGGGLLFKGSGFYATDYKRGSKKGDSKPDSKPDLKEKKPD